MQMRGLVLVGVVLAILGAGALIFGQVGYTSTEPVLKAGPIQIDKKESHTISIPTIGGVVLLIAGLGFVFMGMKKT
jgi:UDP-N-acetylmuramyl pentapeptide phosphotransferase/UDP-N-acetylglucosamine-1-phosphate transferase